MNLNKHLKSLFIFLREPESEQAKCIPVVRQTPCQSYLLTTLNSLSVPGWRSLCSILSPTLHVCSPRSQPSTQPSRPSLPFSSWSFHSSFRDRRSLSLVCLILVLRLFDLSSSLCHAHHLGLPLPRAHLGTDPASKGPCLWAAEVGGRL